MPEPNDLPDVARVRRLRATAPESIARALAARRHRPLLEGDERLFLVAADHPARGVLAVGRDELAMADRDELLGRLALALAHPGVDGVLASPDVVDDLALLGCLDGKVVVGSVNRGGLRGASFEMDDRTTGYDIAGVRGSGLDAAKVLLRINLTDAGTVRTLETVAAQVSEAAAAGLPIMIEPFLSEWRDGRIVNDLRPDAVITSMAIASALGNSSAYTWLKLPVVDDMERVMKATTLPTLLLGGDPVGDEEAVFSAWASALALPGIRGLVAGRALLYPSDGNVAAAIDRAAALVHGELSR